MAYRKAGADETEVVEHLETAADEIELSLSTVHRHTDAKRVGDAIDRILGDVSALLKHFPDKSLPLAETSSATIARARYRTVRESPQL